MSEPVAVTNPASWWQVAGIWTAVLMFAGLIVRQIGPWRKQSIDAAQKIRDELIERVTLLEGRVEQARKDAEEKTEKLTQAYDLKIEKLSAGHEAVVAIMRHRVNNLKAALDALLLLLEQDPTKAAEAVRRIKEMRARQDREETTEKALLHAGRIAGATGTFTFDDGVGS